MNLQTFFLTILLLLPVSGFSMDPNIDRNSTEYQELFFDALDKKSTKPIHPAVVEDLKCRYLVYDIVSSKLGLDDDDAIAAGLVHEALKNKVFNGNYTDLIGWWQQHKGHENTVKLCPEARDFVNSLFESAN